MAEKKYSKTIIGKNSFFEGKFYIQGEIEVSGKCEGVFVGGDYFHIAENGKVKLNIKAKNIIVEGIVIGNLVAENRIILYPTARVLGNIKAPELIIEKGAIIEGKCTITHDFETSVSDLILKLYEEK